MRARRRVRRYAFAFLHASRSSDAPRESPSTPCRLAPGSRVALQCTIGSPSPGSPSLVGASTFFAHDGCLRPRAPCTRSCRRARSRRLGRRYEPAARPVLIGGDALSPPVVAELSRREVLARAGLAAGALALGARLRPGRGCAESPRLGLGAVAVRARSRADPPHLVPARDAPASGAGRDRGARQRLDANPVEYLHGPGDQLSAAREAAGRFLGAAPSEVALTDSTTMGLGLLYTRLALGADDEVVTTEHDFYATHESPAFRRAGAARQALRRRPPGLRGRDREPHPACGHRADAPGRAAWVHSSTGVRLPLRSIAQALPDRVLVWSTAPRLGARAETVRDLGCDASSRLPNGSTGREDGVLWAKSACAGHAADDPVLRRVEHGAWVAGGVPAASRMDRPSRPAGSSRSSTGGPPRGVRLPPGDRPGARRGRIRGLSSRLKAALVEVRGVRLRTPQSPGLSAGLVCFEVAGRDPTEVVSRLASRGIVASVTPYATRYVRLGPGIVNTPEHVDAAVRAIAALR